MIGYMRNDINVDGGCFVGKNDSWKMAEGYRRQWETVENPHLQNMKELVKNGLRQQKVYEELFSDVRGLLHNRRVIYGATAPFFCVVCPAKLEHTCRCKSGHGNRQ